MATQLAEGRPACCPPSIGGHRIAGGQTSNNSRVLARRCSRRLLVVLGLAVGGWPRSSNWRLRLRREHSPMLDHAQHFSDIGDISQML
eukprot:6100921-Lingulodinium_polyedra.AAC.1